MTLDQVIANLDRTITGKVLYVSTLRKDQPADLGSQAVKDIAVQLIDMNIEELDKIREDLLKVKNGA